MPRDALQTARDVTEPRAPFNTYTATGIARSTARNGFCDGESLYARTTGATLQPEDQLAAIHNGSDGALTEQAQAQVGYAHQ